MPIHEIDAKTLKGWLDKNEALVVDVREPSEYSAQCIPEATLLPLDTVAVDKLPDAHGKKIVIHCSSGKRGEKACEKLLKDNAALELYHLKGGMLAWTEAGYVTKTSGKFFLPLDRQVQTIIGTGVLLGVLLGYLVHPGFFLISAFFGAGLIYAGLSGTCMLAILMAKMPWNQEKNNQEN